MPAGVHDTGPGMPRASRPTLVGWSPSTSLSGSTAIRTASKSTWPGAGYCTSMPSTDGSALSRSTASIACAVVQSVGRWTWGLSIPSSSALRIFIPTYRAEGPSSPIKTVASPGVCPAAMSALIRGSRSENTASATGAPGIITAVTTGSYAGHTAAPVRQSGGVPRGTEPL